MHNDKLPFFIYACTKVCRLLLIFVFAHSIYWIFKGLSFSIIYNISDAYVSNMTRVITRDAFDVLTAFKVLIVQYFHKYLFGMT